MSITSTDTGDGERLGYRPEEAAAVSGIGRTKIFAAIKVGHLEARKYGRATIITRDALRRFLESLPVRRLARNGRGAA
jgi:excisionase family DNA binding protein